MTNSMRNVVTTTTAVALAALFAGCASPTPNVTSEPSATESASAEPEVLDPASAAVTEYLDAIMLGNIAGAWEMLSPETQATYNDSPTTYADYAADNETVTAHEAKLLSDAALVVTPGPENGFQVVSAQVGGVADAWVVRESDAGLRIDDPGVPPTGERPFTWTNPADGVFDAATPPTIYFQKTFGPGGETDVIGGPPDAIVGYADGAEVVVTRDASSGAGAAFVADVPAGARVLTVVWAPEVGNKLWQSSTVTLD